MNETLYFASLIINIGIALAYLLIRTTPENMRRLAYWLLCRARADEEIRAAKRGIESERVIAQKGLIETHAYEARLK